MVPNVDLAGDMLNDMSDAQLSAMLVDQDTRGAEADILFDNETPLEQEQPLAQRQDIVLPCEGKVVS